MIAFALTGYLLLLIAFLAPSDNSRTPTLDELDAMDAHLDRVAAQRRARFEADLAEMRGES